QPTPVQARSIAISSVRRPFSLRVQLDVYILLIQRPGTRCKQSNTRQQKNQCPGCVQRTSPIKMMANRALSRVVTCLVTLNGHVPVSFGGHLRGAGVTLPIHTEHSLRWITYDIDHLTMRPKRRTPCPQRHHAHPPHHAHTAKAITY